MAATMLDRLLEAISVLVTQRRGVVLLAVAVVAGLFGSQLPKVKSDPSPQKVVSAFENQDQILADLAETFGDAENVLLVLVEADDVLSKPAAQYVHDLSRAVGRVDGITKVSSITVTPLPHKSGPVSDEEMIDEELEKELMLDEPDDSPDGAKPKPRPKKAGGGEDFNWKSEYGVDAAMVQPIIDGDPEHFPRGIYSLSQRAEEEGLRADPIVKGDEVLDAELASMRAVIEDSPLVRGHLVSADHKLAVIAVYLDLSLTEQKDVTAALDRVHEAISAAKSPDGTTTRLGGLPHMRDSLVKKIKADQMTLNPAIGIVCILVLTVTFRWLPGVLSPLAAVGLTALIVVGTMGMLDIRLNVITNILPPLLIIIGISDSIHLIARYRDELKKKDDRIAAGQTTVRHLGAACFLTSATTAVGFGSLAVARTEMLREFGLLAAFGVLLAYIITMSFLPAVLTLVRSPNRPGKDAQKTGCIERAIFVLTRRVLKHPWRWLGAAMVLTLLSAGAATRIDADVRLMDQFDEGDEVWTVTHLLEEKARGVRPLEVSMRSDVPGRFYDPEIIASIDDVAAWAETQKGVLGTASYSDLLHEVSFLATGDPKMRDVPFRGRAHVDALVALSRRKGDDPLAPFLAADGQRARLTINLADIGSNASIVIIDEVERRLNEAFASKQVSFDLTGESYTGSRGRDAVLRDLVWGLLLAFGVIFSMLALLLRSPRLAIISIPPNIIPLVITAAYMAIRGIPLNTATAITFSIGIGLAVDGTIHVLARYREEHRRGLGVNVALLRAARGTGRAIVVTCVTLTLGFSVVMLSSFISVRQFGELISVTVLGILFGTVVVQPAILKVAGARALRTY